MQSIYSNQNWTVEVDSSPPVLKVYDSAAKACDAVAKALEYYQSIHQNVTITMKDPHGRWMLIEKTEEKLTLINELDL